MVLKVLKVLLNVDKITSVNRGEEECAQVTGRKARGKETIRKTKI
jgi:hypothetical protein